MGEDEAGITPGARIADGAGPAQLVIEKAANAVGGDIGFDHFGGVLGVTYGATAS